MTAMHFVENARWSGISLVFTTSKSIQISNTYLQNSSDKVHTKLRRDPLRKDIPVAQFHLDCPAL